MKKNDLLSLIERFMVPAALIVCGLTLLFSPDTASVLVANIFRVILLISAIFTALAALMGGEGKMKRIILAVGLYAISRWLGANPLGLAAGAGKIVGILILVRAVSGFLKARQSVSRVLYLVCGVLGLVLLVMPMTASRLVFTLCGLGVTAAGVVMLLSRLREQKYLGGGDNPNIIDAL